MTRCLSRCKSGWDKTKPCMVISALNVKKDRAFIPGVVMAATRNGWMEENLCSDGAKKVWQTFTLRNACLCGTLGNVTFLMKGTMEAIEH